MPQNSERNGRTKLKLGPGNHLKSPFVENENAGWTLDILFEDIELG